MLGCLVLGLLINWSLIKKNVKGFSFPMKVKPDEDEEAC